jgi:hypothetical protein
LKRDVFSPLLNVPFSAIVLFFVLNADKEGLRISKHFYLPDTTTILSLFPTGTPVAIPAVREQYTDVLPDVAF